MVIQDTRGIVVIQDTLVILVIRDTLVGLVIQHTLVFLDIVVVDFQDFLVIRVHQVTQDIQV